MVANRINIPISAKMQAVKAAGKRQRLPAAYCLITNRLPAVYLAAYAGSPGTPVSRLKIAAGLAGRPGKIARPGASGGFSQTEAEEAE